MEFVTQLNPGTHIKRFTPEGFDPKWAAKWVQNGEESGYSAYDLRVLLKEVLKMQGAEK